MGNNITKKNTLGPNNDIFIVFTHLYLAQPD